MTRDEMLKDVQLWLSAQGFQEPLLITGNDASALAQLLTDTAGMFACEMTVNKPCGMCGGCKQFISNTHPDIVTLLSEKNRITLERVRWLLQLMRTRPLSHARLILIPNAEDLLPEAGNALLASLEDSSMSNHFLLSSKFPTRILATIRSRCQRLWLIHEQNANPKTSSDDMVSFDLSSAFTRTKSQNELSYQDLEGIYRLIDTSIQDKGMSRNSFRALMRLRDYYKIRALRGNSKLARDVLLASLSSIEKY